MSPLSFKDIIGQEKAIGFLKASAATARVASAYLFTGIEGIGKTTAAVAFALLLNCSKPVDGDGCGRCSSCKRIRDGNHPDLIIVERDQDRKVIGIDQIREINRHLAFSPVLGPYRIIIINPAENMSDEAANAFLKNLEEPPPGNVFILIARDPGQLFLTIVSRCQTVPFKPLPTEETISWLMKEGNVDGQKARILARLSEGSLGEAIRLADDEFFADRAGVVTMLHRVAKSPADELLDLAQRFSDLGKSGREQKDERIGLMLRVWKSWFRDILLIKSGGTVDLILNSDLIDRVKKASALYTVDGLMKSLAVIARAERDLMENRNILFLLERSLFGLKNAAKL